MPAAEEKSHFGQPDFRVRNKIFAGLSQDERRGTLKLTPELQDMIMAAKPNGFEPAAGAWGRSGWTYVILPEVEAGALRDLIVEAYRLVAPKRLIAAIAGDVLRGAGAGRSPLAKKKSVAKKKKRDQRAARRSGTDLED